VLGMLLDRAHEMPPDLITPLVAEEAARIGGRDVSILLQDYGQRVLRPLLGRGLIAGEPEEIDDTMAGALPTLPGRPRSATVCQPDPRPCQRPGPPQRYY
jgi:hypothetical protein